MQGVLMPHQASRCNSVSCSSGPRPVILLGSSQCETLCAQDEAMLSLWHRASPTDGADPLATLQGLLATSSSQLGTGSFFCNYSRPQKEKIQPTLGF